MRTTTLLLAVALVVGCGVGPDVEPSDTLEPTGAALIQYSTTPPPGRPCGPWDGGGIAPPVATDCPDGGI